eukprot:scaffold23479_cov143-Cylindrotheca_fusiformis.AAC.11
MTATTSTIMSNPAPQHQRNDDAQYCADDYECFDEYDYDDFSLRHHTSATGGAGSSKTKRRHQPKQGKSGGGSIYSAKHIRAKESLKQRRRK